MSKKILFTANLDSFFTKFLIPQLEYFKNNGYEVHVASKSEDIDIPYCDKKFDVNFARSLNLKQNIESYKQMIELLKNEHYDIISCHTPMGGAITRLAFKNLKIKDTRMVYMVHGFHFYKGSSPIYWLLFYNAEKYLAKYTDRLITINLDDYEIAKKKFKTDVRLVSGIGLDVRKFDFKMTENEKQELRKELGIKKDDYVIIYTAELTAEKRQLWLIETLKQLLKDNQKIHILLPGQDSMNGKVHDLVEKLKLKNQIHVLGFRNDIPKLLNIANLAVSSSIREGLPVNVMEAMYVGLPVVVTACRGNRDLIQNGENGYIVGINDRKDFLNKVKHYSSYDERELKEIKQKNSEIIKDYLLDNVLDKIIEIYIGE